MSGLPFPVRAHEYYAKHFTLVHPWADPTEAGVTVAPVFARFENISADDRLIGAFTEIAGKVELRGAGAAGGESVELDGIALPAGQDVVLEPGGLHLLMRDVKFMLRWDRAYPFTFVFERSGELLTQLSMSAH